jgi:hypothetical protein
MPIPGYTIDFPEFDLANEFEDSYALEKLPTLQKHVGIYLAIRDPDKRFRTDAPRNQLAAQFEFDLIDESGAVVAQLRHSLAKMHWASPEGGDYGLYDLDQSFFNPNPGARYRLRVHYSPDPALNGLIGFIHIRCGGHI